MKVVRGINPDFADDDELDVDALSAIDDFHNGRLSFNELKAYVGREAAEYAVSDDADSDLFSRASGDGLLDNPEEF